MIDSARPIRAKVENGACEQAPTLAAAPARRAKYHQQGRQWVPGLVAQWRSMRMDAVGGKLVDEHTYELIENWLPLLVAIIAIGLKLWLYW